VSKLDELEAKAKAAAALEEPWGPTPCDHEEGGKSAIVRLHQIQDAEMCADYDAEEAAADDDCAYLAAANPATVLAMVEVIRAAKEMRKSSALWNQPSLVRDFDAALAKLEGKP